jgi:SagB-type dehydrogenase family enzyme
LEALEYHQLTKHFPTSVRHSGHRLDWAIRPNPFKDYLGLDPIPLPTPAEPTGYPATLAVTEQTGQARTLDAAELARILNLAAGVSRIYQLPDGEQLFFRTYACAGALYPIELYLACGGVDGLSPGLYHFHPLEGALRSLRPGDPRPWLVRASGARSTVATAPVSVILTGIAWRTTWKYQARGYRHLYWDSGMILANLLALAASGGHPAEVVLGFADEELDLLLGVDGDREMPICIVPIGTAAGPPSDPVGSSPGPAEPIEHPAAALSREEASYPEITAAHEAGRLGSSEAVALWRADRGSGTVASPPDPCPERGIEKVILRRGSKRVFKPSPIPVEQLGGIIDHATHRLGCDWGPPLVQVTLIANAVEGLEPGAYAYIDGFELLASGNFRQKAGFLCLDQPLGRDAAATLFLLADLASARRTLGNRGYRAAQLEAGIVAGRLYLGAYACRFGATGLTFYDDEVREFFEIEAEPMMVIALGH